MACTSQLLERAGYLYWDLGMELPYVGEAGLVARRSAPSHCVSVRVTVCQLSRYKHKLGARCIPRQEFMLELAAARARPNCSPLAPRTPAADLIPKPPAAPAPMPAAEPEAALPTGRQCPPPRVRLHGLVKAPQLNGLCGRMVGEDAQSGRWTVQLDDGRAPIKLKPENCAEET